MDRSRKVELEEGGRLGARNQATLAATPLERSRPAGPVERLFLLHYPRIRTLWESWPRPGLAVLALEGEKVAGTLRLAADPEGIHTAVVGRHNMTDLYLGGDAALSLRHLLVVTYPLQPGRDLRFRLVDLRSRSAFLDEQGRRLEALEAEGPVFIHCGRYTLLFFPTGDGLPWPEQAKDGWECIPERVYLDETEAEPDRWERKQLHGRRPKPPTITDGTSRSTAIRLLSGPLRARRHLVEEGESAVGQLLLNSPQGTGAISIGAKAAREGVLLGRYDRCDREWLPGLADPSISRVHLLLLQVDDTLYAIDTASSNGVWMDHQAIRVVPLRQERTLQLSQQAELRWEPLG